MTLVMARKKRPPAVGVLVLFIFSIIGVFFCLVQVSGATGSSESWPVLVMASSLSWIIVYLTATYSYYRTLYLFGNAYIIALFMFHLGLIYQVALGAVEASQWTSGAMAEWVEAAAWPGPAISHALVTVSAFWSPFRHFPPLCSLPYRLIDSANIGLACHRVL